MKNENKLISMNVLPIAICIGTWGMAVFFLLCNREEREFAITTFLLVTIQLISSLTDLHSRTIPLKLMAISLISGLMFFGIFNKTNNITNYIFGGISAFVVMILLIFISKKQVGGGDVALMTVTGFLAGINSFFSILFLSIILTGVYSLFLVFAKKASRKTEIPFAPFILFGTVILVLCSVN